MKLTTKGRFAVTAMLDLALRDQQGPATLAGIGARQGISLSYLEQLFGKLRRQGLVQSVRGPGGGYRLAHSARKITVADIISAVDEALDATQCGGMQNCSADRRCITHDLWTALNRTLHKYLNSVTLQDLVDRQRAQGDKAAAPEDPRPAGETKPVWLAA